MGAKFQTGQKILYGYDWDKKGKIDSVLDLGKDRYEYAISLNEVLKTTTTNDVKQGLKTNSEWKTLSPPEYQNYVAERYLKAA